MKKILFALALLLVFAIPVAAQTPILVTSASTVQFQKSTDHDTIVGGTALLTSYKLTYCLVSAPTNCPIVIDLGKPTPDATGKITAVSVFGGLVKNTVYTAGITSVGPGGSSATTPGDVPFWSAGPPAAVTTVTIKQ